MARTKSKAKYRTGDIVRCTFRGAGWIGVVVDSDGKGINTIVPMIDRNGHPQRRRYVKRYSQFWLEDAELDPTKIRRDWL